MPAFPQDHLPARALSKYAYSRNKTTYSHRPHIDHLLERNQGTTSRRFRRVFVGAVKDKSRIL